MRTAAVIVTVLASTLPAAPDTLAEGIGPLVVTPSRVARPAANTPASIERIGRDQIDNSGAHSAAELLRRATSLELTRSGGPGQQTSAFIRGAESNHTLVLIDGVPMNPGTIGTAALQNIDASLIEQIEIVRGPRSVQYGSEAIGGVINIITRQPSQAGHSASAEAIAGGDGLWAANGNWQWQGQAAHASLALATRSTDGFPTRVESNIDRGHDNQSIQLRGGWRGAAWSADVSHLDSSGETEYLGFFLDPLDQDYRNQSTQASIKLTPASGWEALFRISRTVDDIDQNQSADFAYTRRWLYEWQNDVQFGAHLLTLGAEFEDEDTESLVFGTGFDDSTDANAVYIQDDWQRGAHRLLLGLRRIDHETAGNHVVWNLGYSHSLDSGTVLFANAGSGFRAPDSTDRFGFGGNPDLEPERSRSLELGLRQQIGSIEWEVTAFATRIRDLIVFEDPDGFLGPLPGSNENIQRAAIDGLELRGSWSDGPWRVSANATLQDPRNTTLGRQLARRAKRQANASISYGRGNWRVQLDGRAQSSRPDSDFSTTRIAGYAVADLGAHWDFGRHITLGVNVENLFDHDYQEIDGFRTQDRLLSASIRLRRL